jgi:hypothetical protein
MARFIYIHTQFGLEPQIIRDEKMFEYTVERNKSVRVVYKRDLSEAEAKLTIDELVKLYPYNLPTGEQ